jgi:Na+-transporting methylmalonyl-CoA/oxaloacetate decarboxylase gamma subunit
MMSRYFHHFQLQGGGYKIFVKKYTKEAPVKSKILSILILAFFLLSACVPAETPSPTATAEKKPVGTETVAEVQPEADECVACHTDKERLIETAAPVVEAEGESKGVG